MAVDASLAEEQVGQPQRGLREMDQDRGHHHHRHQERRGALEHLVDVEVVEREKYLVHKYRQVPSSTYTGSKISPCCYSTVVFV